MRPRLTYANVTATLALFFALTGGAIAARHYLINSTSQISPKVLKKLQGHAGPRGVPGAPGTSGAEGPKGEPGPLLATLPSGKTEKGAYNLAGNRYSGGGAYYPSVEATYPIPIGFEPTITLVKPGGSPTAACPGTVEAPTAAPGNLCIYAQYEVGAIETAANTPAKGHFGWRVRVGVLEGAPYEDSGTWAVTAP